MAADQHWGRRDAGEILRRAVPDETSHKYSRGVLGVRTGSQAYPGAAVLTVEAAWRTGIGLVRFSPGIEDGAPRFGLPSPAAAVLAARPETVFANPFETSDNKLSAWLIGSGTDASQRGFAEHEALTHILAGEHPVVVDAGALELAAEARTTPGTNPPAASRLPPLILTPHAGEFARLCNHVGLSPALTPANLEALANTLGATVLLKGSRTRIASPGTLCLVAGPATPWLATAGTGDVLAGVLGALVATFADEISVDPSLLAQLGATAAVIHDAAARIAGHPVTAMDVARALPQAVAELLCDASS